VSKNPQGEDEIVIQGDVGDDIVCSVFGTRRYELTCPGGHDSGTSRSTERCTSGSNCQSESGHGDRSCNADVKVEEKKKKAEAEVV